MKLLKIVMKNFKLILRSKSSAFVVLIGPLIIVALIALAFSNSNEFKINIGVISDDSELSQQIIAQLENDHNVINFENSDSCNNQIKSRIINLCIEFPENFLVTNENQQKIKFFVDQSRINVVETVIASVSSSINIKSDELSKSFTEDLLQTIDTSSEKTAQNENIIKDLKEEIASLETQALSVEASSKNINLNSATSEISEIEESIKILTKVDELLVDLDDLLDTLETDEVYTTKTNSVRNLYDELNGTANTTLIELNTLLTSVKQKFSAAESNINTISKSALEIKNNLGPIQTNLEQISQGINEIQDRISNIQIKSSDNIVAPFTIEINPILATSNKSTFMFPYFIALIILFVGIMLSSTLVVLEKRSSAYFRTFTTPTSEFYHVLARYLTNIIVLLFQLSLVLVAANFYLKINILENLPITILILFLGTSLFIFLGMILGYLFKTQEGTTIASVSVGSICLFLSNLILPVESYPELIKQIFILNPYMLFSELLKKSMLFNVGLFEMKKEMIIITSYVILFIIGVVIFQKVSFTRLLNNFSKRKVLERPHITSENYFRLENGKLLKNKKDLFNVISKMKEEELKEYVTSKNNEFALWIKHAFKEKKLAKKIKKAKTKDNMLIVLSVDAEREAKSVKK
ncbi:MAG: ABC transporter permease [Candidatus Woesearchaeota archaeon]